LFLKQSYLFKIDLNYMPNVFCVNQDPRTKSNPNGCFVLIHNDWDVNVRYNSIYDVSDIILQNKEYFQ